MSAIVMLAPKLGTKAASRAAIAERSRREPNTLLIVSTTNTLARGGTLEKLSPRHFNFVSALATGPEGFRTHADLFDIVWGQTRDGGPISPIASMSVAANQMKESLDALKVTIKGEFQQGRRLVLRPITSRHAPTEIKFRIGDPSKVHWMPKAIAMRERGASYAAIGKVVERAESVVRRAMLGERTTTRGNRKKPSPEAAQRARDRAEARREAKRTGEPVEQIYARWGCQKVDRSLLWDQRRAASSASEASV